MKTKSVYYRVALVVCTQSEYCPGIEVDTVLCASERPWGVEESTAQGLTVPPSGSHQNGQPLAHLFLELCILLVAHRMIPRFIPAPPLLTILGLMKPPISMCLRALESLPMSPLLANRQCSSSLALRIAPSFLNSSHVISIATASVPTCSQKCPVLIGVRGDLTCGRPSCSGPPCALWV